MTTNESMIEWDIGVYRKTTEEKWQFYVGDDNCLDAVFDTTKDDLIQALNACKYDKQAIFEVWQAWNQALQLNAPDGEAS
jgi:hypothetical protein